MTSAQLIHGDCLEVMPTLPANSVQMVFADLPYGVLQAEWDTQLCLAPLWSEIRRVCNPNFTACFTGTMPFLAKIIISNSSQFRYDMVWMKRKCTNAFQAKTRPMRQHENVAIFSTPSATYNCQKRLGRIRSDVVTQKTGPFNRHKESIYKYRQDGMRAPSTLLQVNETDVHEKRLHPTQKPIALLEWLIKTYTNAGDTVIDPTAGSGTTAIAALRTGRKAICIEKDKTYYDIMCKRVTDEQAQLQLKMGA